VRGFAKSFGLVFGTMLISGVAFAGVDDTTIVKAPAPPPVQAQPAGQKAGNDEIICRKVEPTTGSRLGVKRECHTRQQWNDMQLRGQKALEHLQERGTQGGVPGG
jgi:hypothetical protein